MGRRSAEIRQRFHDRELAELAELASCLDATMLQAGAGAQVGSSSLTLAGITIASAPTGNATADQASIANAITAALSANGSGTVQLQGGMYGCKSSMQSIASVTSSGNTWTVISGSLPTVGSYIVGSGINGRSPQVTKLLTGSTFQTDIAPGSTIGGAIIAVTPAFAMPDGLEITGIGAPHGGVGAQTGGTIVYDSGSGMTFFDRGGNNTGQYSGRKKLHDMGIWGTATAGTYGTVNTTAAVGIWCNNNSQLFERWNLDLMGHWWYSMADDYNANSLDCRNIIASYFGYLAATSNTGAFATDPFCGYAQAALQYENCQAWFGYGNGWQMTGGVGILNGCQYNVIAATSNYQSGCGIATTGNSVLINCYGQGAATYDVNVSYCNVTVVGGYYNSGISYGFFLNGTSAQLNLIGVSLSSHTTASVGFNGGGTVSWSNLQCQDTVFISGGPNPAQTSGAGAYSYAQSTTEASFYTPNLIVAATPVATSTVDSPSNGGEISQIATWGGTYGGNGVLRVTSTVGFPPTGTILVAASGATTATVTYTGLNSNSFTGCAYVSGSTTGTVSTGGLVTSNNVATIPVTASVATYKNNSAATMTLTMTTTGALDGQTTIVRIYDFSAVSQTISWVNTENSTVSAPTASNGSTTLPKTVTFQYNSATTKWRCIESV